MDLDLTIDIIIELTQIIQSNRHIMKPELIVNDEVNYNQIDSDHIIFIGYSCG